MFTFCRFKRIFHRGRGDFINKTAAFASGWAKGKEKGLKRRPKRVAKLEKRFSFPNPNVFAADDQRRKGKKGERSPSILQNLFPVILSVKN